LCIRASVRACVRAFTSLYKGRWMCCVITWLSFIIISVILWLHWS